MYTIELFQILILSENTRILLEPSTQIVNRVVYQTIQVLADPKLFEYSETFLLILYDFQSVPLYSLITSRSPKFATVTFAAHYYYTVQYSLSGDSKLCWVFIEAIDVIVSIYYVQLSYSTGLYCSVVCYCVAGL